MHLNNLSEKECKLLLLIRHTLQTKNRMVINEFRLAKLIGSRPEDIYYYLKKLKRLGYIKLYKRVMFKNIITYCEIINREVEIWKRD